MFFQRRTIPGLAIHSYIVGDQEAGECVVIDPVRDVGEYIETAKSNGLQIIHILETHVHADFVSGALELKKRLDDIPTIHCSGMGGKEWTPSYADEVVEEGDQVKAGSLTFKAVHTPGHTPEHIMWVLVENGSATKLFTGDFLFVGDVGRPDLLGKEAVQQLGRQLYHTVFEKLAPYSDETEVLPAHGAGSLCGKALGSAPSTTLGKERKDNAALKEKPEEKWVADLMEEMPPAPRYFPRMKKVNVQGASILGGEMPGRSPLSPAAFNAEREKGALVLDVRSKEAFSSLHIPGSINIPFSPNLSTWAGWILPGEAALLLVLDHEEHLESVVDQLVRIGFDRIIGYLKGGIWAWEEEALDAAHLHGVTPHELHEALKKEQKHCILDVRTNGEWDAGHIPGALHIHGGLIPDNLDKLPKGKPLSVICGSGFRASVVASYLQREGFKNVSNVFGGMTAWKKEGFPVVAEKGPS